MFCAAAHWVNMQASRAMGSLHEFKPIQPWLSVWFCLHHFRSIHLSNVAIQQFYLNGQRSSKLPDNNFLVSTDFRKYLEWVVIGLLSMWMEAGHTRSCMHPEVINHLIHYFSEEAVINYCIYYFSAIPSFIIINHSVILTYCLHSEIGAPHAWDEIMYPGMKNAVINTLLATMDISERRVSLLAVYMKKVQPVSTGAQLPLNVEQYRDNLVYL